jgi:hypothetical protein
MRMVPVGEARSINRARTYSRMIIFPNPYQRPPAPTNAESLTLLDSALSAFRTRELNGGGTVKSA